MFGELSYYLAKEAHIGDMRRFESVDEPFWLSHFAARRVCSHGAVLIVRVMAADLRQHMNLVARGQSDEPGRSWWWCLRSLRWRPDER